jgi:hypothetical protein
MIHHWIQLQFQMHLLGSQMWQSWQCHQIAIAEILDSWNLKEFEEHQILQEY